jgi:hypothetical protein
MTFGYRWILYQLLNIAVTRPLKPHGKGGSARECVTAGNKEALNVNLSAKLDRDHGRIG